jgi:hypothetical protein
MNDQPPRAQAFAKLPAGTLDNLLKPETWRDPRHRHRHSPEGHLSVYSSVCRSRLHQEPGC